MCAKSRFGRASPWLRKSLSGLRLRHGLRGGGALRETEAVTVATRLFRCPLWHLRRLGCALHPKPPRRVATGPAVLCRKAGGRARRGHPESRQVGRPPRTGGLLGRAVKPGRGPLRRGRRGSRCRGQGRRGGGREPANTAGGLWQESGAGRLGNGGSRRRTGLIRRVPKRRSDGLPARDCWCGSYYLIMSIAIP